MGRSCIRKSRWSRSGGRTGAAFRPQRISLDPGESLVGLLSGQRRVCAFADSIASKSSDSAAAGALPTANWKGRPLPSTSTTLAVRLGYLALSPFIMGLTAIALVPREARAVASLGLSDYAAVVVSFIGGIHWGFAFRQPDAPATLYVWGVVPSLVACLALMLGPAAGLALHATMLAVCYAVDRSVYATQGAASWLPLRLRLTVVAAACCAGGALLLLWPTVMTA